MLSSGGLHGQYLRIVIQPVKNPLSCETRRNSSPHNKGQPGKVLTNIFLKGLVNYLTRQTITTASVYNLITNFPIY